MSTFTTPAPHRRALTLGLWGASVAAAGIFLSGPVGALVSMAVAPQPAWQGPELFAERYHPIQLLPYGFGFVLVGGFVVLHAALVEAVDAARRPFAMAALGFAAVFATLIGFNDVAQIAVVPTLRDEPWAGALVSVLSMSNPSSLAWSVEMFGYGFLGIASLFAIPCFTGPGRLAHATVMLLVINGGSGVLGALATAIDPAWALTITGVAAYVVWNAAVLALAIAVALTFKRWRDGFSPRAPEDAGIARPYASLAR
jgi:hypothetical protein